MEFRRLRFRSRIGRDAVPPRDLVVVEVVRAGDLDRARAELRVRMLVGDDRDLAAMRLRPDRDLAQLADDRRVARVRRMHRHRAVAEHGFGAGGGDRSEEHKSELQSLMRISYAAFCLKKKRTTTNNHYYTH